MGLEFFNEEGILGKAFPINNSATAYAVAFQRGGGSRCSAVVGVGATSFSRCPESACIWTGPDTAAASPSHVNEFPLGITSFADGNSIALAADSSTVQLLEPLTVICGMVYNERYETR